MVEVIARNIPELNLPQVSQRDVSLVAALSLLVQVPWHSLDKAGQNLRNRPNINSNSNATNTVTPRNVNLNLGSVPNAAPTV